VAVELYGFMAVGLYGFMIERFYGSIAVVLDVIVGVELHGRLTNNENK